MLARAIEEVLRRERGIVLAGLIRRFGDFAMAEDLLQEACVRALRVWPQQGLPHNPAAWLTTVARNHGLDMIRRDARLLPDSQALTDQLVAELPAEETAHVIEDDRLRLIFVCCHPALNPKAQAMLALRTLCGLSTREIARAYLDSEDAAAQRMVRAQRKISEARIPFSVPAEAQLPERLALVLQVLYLMFNEGYGATSGAALLRADLASEAIRLARMLRALLPFDAEVAGLLALMLLQHARRDARLDPEGSLATLEEQDRMRWHAGEIEEGKLLLEAAMALRAPGPYQLQAAIAALHAGAASAQETDWPQIAALYGALLRYWPTPVVELNAAVALGMADNYEAALRFIGGIEARGALAGSHYLYAAKADLLRRMGRVDEAFAAFDQAIALVANEVERDFLIRRRDSL
jgi:RNA polymerase sigma-70 factor (ECF subfamily)